MRPRQTRRATRRTTDRDSREVTATPAALRIRSSTYAASLNAAMRSCENTADCWPASSSAYPSWKPPHRRSPQKPLRRSRRSRRGLSPTPLLEGLRRACGGRGGVGCSVADGRHNRRRGGDGWSGDEPRCDRGRGLLDRRGGRRAVAGLFGERWVRSWGTVWCEVVNWRVSVGSSSAPTERGLEV